MHVMTLDDLETYTKPLCSAPQYARKVENFRRVERSFLRRDERCEGRPVHLHLEATGDCNLPCPICPRGRGHIERTGHLPFDVFEKLFSELSDGLCNIVISGWGEPLLNPATTAMIAHATRHAVPVFLNTNGTVLAGRVEELLDARLTLVNVSIDGAVSRSTHVYTQAAPFERVIEGVARLRQAKDRRGCRHPVIHGQFIVNEGTVDEIEPLTKWAFDLGVDHVKFKRRHHTMPGQEERSKVLSVDKLLEITQRRRLESWREDLGFSHVTCAHPWHSVYLGCTGKLGLCSWDPHQVVTLGSTDEDFESIWNGDAMRTVRRWHTGRDPEVGDPCLKCNRLPGYLHHEDAGEREPTAHV